MEKSFPFNAVVTDGIPDRIYTAEDFAAERAAYVSNGVAAADALAVSPSASGGLAVDVAAGIAVIDGYTYFNTAPLTLTAAAAHATLPRVDLAVLRLDLDAREMRCVLRTGTPAVSPAAPEITSSETVRELPLASLTVAAGAAALESAAVTDQRVRADYILNRLEVDELLARYEAAMRRFFDVEDAAALAAAAKAVRTDAGENTVLCGDGVYRAASLDGYAYEELARFTTDGTFYPAQHPTRDGRYDILLQGGGGSGAYASAANTPYGGEAGGFLSLRGIPLRSGVGYAVTVGAGGEGCCANLSYQSARGGNAGGDTSFAGFTAPGGRGGVYGSSGSDFDTPTVSNGFSHAAGTPLESGKGGDSFFADGGRNNLSGSGGAGALGSGGGAAYRISNDGTYLSGKGGDGIVIIYGARPL